MKKWRKVLLVAILCMSFICTAVTTASAKEAFDILDHKIDVVVKENGELDITETMSVHFNEQRHGIYVNIPKEYDMKWQQDGSTVLKSYTFPVKNGKVLSDHKYDTENERQYYQFIIGDEKKYANINETYKWSYTIVTKDLDLDGLQMVFLNLITSGWDTTTDHCEFTIQFPKSINASDIYVAYPDGMFNGTGSEGSLTVKASGNTISGSYNSQITSNQAITIQVLLPENYFTFTSYDDYCATALIAAGIFAVISTVLFLVIGKDDPVVVTAEYHTPADLDSAQVGVIINEKVNDNNVISLLLDWGRRGIITITETVDDLQLAAVGGLPQDALSYEKTLYDGLFSRVGDSVMVSSLNDKFYTTFEKVKIQLEDYYKDSIRELSTKKSKRAAMVCLLLCWFPAVVMFNILYINYYWDFYCIPVSIIMIFLLVLCAFLVRNYAMDVYVSTPVEKYVMIGFTALTYVLPLAVVLLMMKIADVSMVAFVSLAFIEAIVIVEAAYMRKRTIYGNSMLGRVLGLREFIMNAKDRDLEEIQEKNPFYFYDILPYAYSLGLENKWNEQFKNLTVKQCDWYIPYHTHYDHYHMTHSLDSHLRTIQTSMTSVAAESGSSSSGGGFSGGGGFGGSSGGSW